MGSTAVSSVFACCAVNLIECRHDKCCSSLSPRTMGKLSLTSAALAPASSTRPWPAAHATKQKLSIDFNVQDDEDSSEDDEAADFGTMEEWLTNKPSGFGLLEYDTSVEERLMEEIEAERKAQAAAKALKGTKVVKKSAKRIDNPPPEGTEVYVGNLPKKRNVGRDLRAALNAVEGLLHVRPIMRSRDEKTREPDCKGLAFLTFATKDFAQEFVEKYSGVNVKFGKIQKKLTCELAASNSPFKNPGSSKKGPIVPRLNIRERSGSDLGSSDSSLSREELPDVRVQSSAANEVGEMAVLSDFDSFEGQDDDDDDDLLGTSEDELHNLEQAMWAELDDEDEDVFEVDRELGEKSCQELDVALNLSESRASLGYRVGSSDNLEQADLQSPHYNQVHSAGNGGSEENEYEDEAHLRDRSRGQGFGSEIHEPDGISGDKNKRIEELEFKVKELQLQLKRNELKEGSVQAVEMTDPVNPRDERVQALEKRMQDRARAQRMSNLDKDSVMKNDKKVSAPKKATSLKARVLSKENSNRPRSQVEKLTAGSRLKKKERKIFTDVVSKYSSSAE